MTKRCPFCAEEIQAAAIKCKHCGTLLDGSVPFPVVTTPVRLPPPPPHSVERLVLQRGVRRRRAAIVAAAVASVGALGTLGFIVYRRHGEQAHLDAVRRLAQGGRCDDADREAADLYDLGDQSEAAKVRLACDVAALDGHLRRDECDGAADRVDELAQKYTLPASQVIATIEKPLGACMVEQAQALATKAQCDDARKVVEHARALLGDDAPDTLGTIGAVCQAAVAAQAATVRVEQIKGLMAQVQRSGPASGATLLVAPADFERLYSDLRIDANELAQISDPVVRQQKLQEDQLRHDAAVKSVYLAAADKAYARYDASSKLVVFDDFQYLHGQSFYHFSFKAADPNTALYPNAPSYGLVGEKANQIAQLSTDPDTAKTLTFGVETGSIKVLLAFVPGKVDDSSPWSAKTVTMADLKGAWLADLAKGTVTPLTIAGEPGTGGGGDSDEDPFAGP